MFHDLLGSWRKAVILMLLVIALLALGQYAVVLNQSHATPPTPGAPMSGSGQTVLLIPAAFARGSRLSGPIPVGSVFRHLYGVQAIRDKCGPITGTVVWADRNDATQGTQNCRLRAHVTAPLRTQPTPLPAPTATPTSRPIPTPYIPPTPRPTPTAPSGSSCDQAASACASYVLGLINQSRAQYGYPALQLDGTESGCAQSHAQHMADVGAISHDQFPADICVSYSTAGENVGEASGGASSALALIHQMMMEESGYTAGCQSSHKCNILYPQYRRVGIGVVNSGGTIWLSEDFVG